MPPSRQRVVRNHGSQAQQQTIVEEWKSPDKYSVLIPIQEGSTRERLKDIYCTNHWGLDSKMSALKEQNMELGLSSNSVSWLNNIQYLVHPNPDDIVIKNEIKHIDFASGAYKDIYANNKDSTEKKYADRIKFFAKTFPVFNQYSNVDDLSWVVKNETELMIQILNYHNSHYDTRKKEYVSNTIETLNKDFKSVLRVIKLLVGEDAEIRYKWSALQINLTDIEKMTDSENQLKTKNELIGFVKYEDLVDIQEKLEEKWRRMYMDSKNNNNTNSNNSTFQLHQLHLLLALYIYDFPSRHEKMDLYVIKSIEEVEPNKNFVIINPSSKTSCEFVLNADVKQHAPIRYKLLSCGSKSAMRQYNLKLDKILKESLSIYPRDSIMITASKKKPTVETVKGWLRDLLPKKNLNVNNIRSAFATYWYDQMNNSDKNLMARRMRTSKEIIQTSYIKKINDPLTQISIKPDPDAVEPERQLKARQGTSAKSPVKIEDELEDTENTNPNIQKTNIENKKSDNIITIVIGGGSKDTAKTSSSRADSARMAMARYYDKNKEEHNRKMREYNRQPSTYQARYLKELNSGNRETLSDKLKEKYGIMYDNENKTWTCKK